LFPLFLRTHYYHDPLSKTPVLFTIHDLSFRGNFAAERFSLLELGGEYFTPDSLEFYGGLSFVKAGILYSDILATGSHRYLEDICTKENGFRLDGVLNARKDRLFGVINGINVEVWNPESDQCIVRNYSCSDLSGKAECRKQLIRDAGWDPQSNAPVIAWITRFAKQKGLDLIKEGLERILDQNILLLILGTGGGDRSRAFFENFKQRCGKRLHVAFHEEETFKHRVISGSDFLLMPGRYEPGEVNPMYNLRYGSVPIASTKGCLDDMVVEWNETSQTGNGFKFQPYTVEALMDTLRKAMRAFENKQSWNKLMLNGMNTNFSWKNSALAYMSLYDQAIQLKS
jgi:starch synthase